jgi:hypothetical protein
MATVFVSLGIYIDSNPDVYDTSFTMLLANHGPVPEGGTLGLAFGIMSHSLQTRVIGQDCF